MPSAHFSLFFVLTITITSFFIVQNSCGKCRVRDWKYAVVMLLYNNRWNAIKLMFHIIVVGWQSSNWQKFDTGVDPTKLFFLHFFFFGIKLGHFTVNNFFLYVSKTQAYQQKTEKFFVSKEKKFGRINSRSIVSVNKLLSDLWELKWLMGNLIRKFFNF